MTRSGTASGGTSVRSARRWGRFLAATALLVALVPSAARATDLGYTVTIPDQPGSLPLVVWLHGCGADPRAYGLDRYAEAKGFAVAYPVAPSGCWTTTADEAAAVAAITRNVQATHGLDRARTYVAGHSAGASLAQLVAATHPDLYAAAGFVSGATSTVPAGGRVPAYFVWGTHDRITSYLTGRVQLLQWLKTPTPPRTSVQPQTGTVPTFLWERYRRPCADVDFATGIGMGHVPDFNWPAGFPALTTFLLSHRLGAC
jgi:poly(3-hydroxybutyrate) depolymerase